MDEQRLTFKKRLAEIGAHLEPASVQHERRVSCPSDSNPNKKPYIVSIKRGTEEWQCSCMAWTRHVPRRDCKHIRRVKACFDMSNSIDFIFED